MMEKMRNRKDIRKRMRMKRGIVAGAALLLCGGCAAGNMQQKQQYTGMQEITEVDENLIVVGFSQVGSESDWRNAHTQSVKEALTEENGFYLIYEDAQQKQENQIKALRSFILQEVDYIVLAPIVETGWEAVLQEAKDAGIPVIMDDRMADVDEELYTCWLGTNAEKEGEDAGLWLEAYLEKEGRAEEKIRIVTIQGTTGATAQIGRTNGFDKVLRRHDNWEMLEMLDGDFTQAKGQEVMAEKEGEDAGLWLEAYLEKEGRAEEKIRIVTIQGTTGATAQIGRTNGFDKVLRRHDNWEMLEMLDGDFTQAKGQEVMETLLEKYADIDVVVCENDNMAFGAVDAIKAAGRTCGPDGDIIILSFDAVKAAFDAMIAGDINAVFECNPLHGPKLQEIINSLAAGKHVDKIQYMEEAYFDTTMDLESIRETRAY